MRRPTAVLGVLAITVAMLGVPTGVAYAQGAIEVPLLESFPVDRIPMLDGSVIWLSRFCVDQSRTSGPRAGQSEAPYPFGIDDLPMRNYHHSAQETELSPAEVLAFYESVMGEVLLTDYEQEHGMSDAQRWGRVDGEYLGVDVNPAQVNLWLFVNDPRRLDEDPPYLGGFPEDATEAPDTPGIAPFQACFKRWDNAGGETAYSRSWENATLSNVEFIAQMTARRHDHDGFEVTGRDESVSVRWEVVDTDAAGLATDGAEDDGTTSSSAALLVLIAGGLGLARRGRAGPVAIQTTAGTPASAGAHEPPPAPSVGKAADQQPGSPPLPPPVRPLRHSEDDPG